MKMIALSLAERWETWFKSLEAFLLAVLIVGNGF